MDCFFSFLLFAVLFYAMMRFGCGAHVVHGKHGGKETADSNNTRHVDPVCGKNLIPSKGYGMMHEDRLYRFCSRQCLDAFEVEPDRYIPKSLETQS